MKLALLTLALLLCALPAFAAEDEIPEDLRKADYITAVDVEAEVPYGELFIDRGVVAIFPRLEDRLAGMLIGNVRLNFDRLPNDGVAEGGGTVSEQGVVRFRIERAFLSASHKSDILVRPLGRALAARRWEGLKKEEQADFLAMYNEAILDYMVATDGPESGLPLRDPKDKEFFTAFRLGSYRKPDPNGSTLEFAVAQYTFWVNSDGSEVRLSEAPSTVVD